MNVYVLSGNDKLYVGMTENLSHRLDSHRELKCVTTKRLFGGVFVLEHVWEVPTFTLASKLERWLHIEGDIATVELMLDVPLWCGYLEKLVSSLRTTVFEIAREARRG